MGRPSSYTKAIANKICKEIATTSNGLATICKSPKMPSPATVHNWLNNEKHKEFLENYVRARTTQADLLADQIIEIADDSTGDVTITEGGKFVMDGEFAARSRIKIDARKWKASKLAPKKYGDKLDVTTDGEQITQPSITISNNDKDINLGG